MQPTFLFYDIETSGLNKCFDQILQFAAIRTDLELQELEQHDILIKLNPDVVPSPKAILTHKIPLHTLNQQGLSEYDAIKFIHQLFNTPFTISAGYNNLNFDDEFLRFAFYRNLLPPYTHQYANGCGRIDLYPITVIYYLFHPDVLIWPKIEGNQTFRLEHLSKANNLASQPAHNAMADVKATLALAKKLHKKQKIWDYLRGYFDKSTDNERLDKLDKLNKRMAAIEKSPYSQAILIDGSLGAKNNYQTIVLNLGWHKHYKNQTLWLDLCNPKLTSTAQDTNSIVNNTAIYRKKLAEPPLLLPTIPRLLRHLTKERQDLAAKNLTWLHQNPQILEAISAYHQNYTYPLVPNLDIDAALYQVGFPSDYEQSLSAKFHAANIDEKIKMLEIFPHANLPNLRTQALRLLGRNYFAKLPHELQSEFNAYLQKLNTDNPALISRDYRNEKRLTPQQALHDIEAIKTKQNNLSSQELILLEELGKYLKNLFCNQPT